MKKLKKENLLEFILGVASLIFAVTIWIIVEKTVKNEYLVPSFKQTVKSAFAVFCEGFFWRALAKTLLKVFFSVIISFILALIVAGLGKVVKGTKSFVKPIVSILRTLPTMAVLVLILIYSGRTVAPIIVSSLVLFPMMYAQFCTAFDSIDEGIIRATRVFKLSKKDRLFKVYVPMVAPSVLSHLGGNVSFAIKLVISAEIMASTFTSLGGMMQEANAILDVPRLMALTIIAVILGILFELIFHVIFNKSFKWYKGGKEL